MKFNLFHFLLFFLGINLYAQEIPPIQNFTPKEYDGEHQNWAISQASSKSIFIANHTSLIEFDGNKWNKSKLPYSTIIRSVKAHGKKVYTGSYREFGYWEKDITGQLQYTSLSDKLKSPLATDEEFWDIMCIDNLVLFQSLDRIYIYDTLEDVIKIIEANTKKAKLHIVKNKVYFQKEKDGLFTIENGKAVLVSNDPIVTDQPIIGIYEAGDNLMIITENSHFYLYDFKSFRSWQTDVDNLGVKLYSSVRLKDRSFVLGSIANGFYHLSTEGKLMRNINKTNGLNNNTVLSLFQDMDNNLWLGLDSGISVMNLYSPFNEFVDKLGNIGLVYAAMNHNGYLYLGTNQGLFSRRIGTSEEFKLIKGTEGQIWSLQLVHSTLFCGHNNGTFVVKGSNATLVSDFPGTWAVKPLKHKDNLVLQGNYNGLSILEKKSGSWSLRNIIEGFDISSRFFETDSLEVRINHEQKGLYHLELDQNLYKVTSVDNRLPLGHSSNLFQFKGRLFYKTNDGIYGFDSSLDEISLDSAMTQIAFVNNESPISIIIPDTPGQKLWFFTDSGIKYINQNTLSGKLGKTNIPMPNALRVDLGVAGFENISRIADDEYLIGSSNGYVTLDLDKVQSTDHNVNINSVYFGDYRTASTKTPLSTFGEFNYSQNNLKFEFGVTEFDKYTEVRYQHMLKGLYTEWSEWSKSPEVVFKNLPFGEYEFKVKAIVGNQNGKNIASYKFKILRPWYFSNFAIILYSLGLILLFIIIHRLYKRHYRKKQEFLIRKNEKEMERRKLEEKEKIGQILNEKLQDEIENKNRELAISTMSILKKNEFLNAVKDQLKESIDNPKIKSVIRNINRNIENVDDWKFFEEAFNNADKEFLKKLKSIHPDLTPNDLKLCAYLRLNLTSKEIAPLLNISVRSVEVKRYRLRKKMDLQHENSLTDYILNL
ncbi:MAG: two component regulator three y domain-containing protein [Maribacter sp.]|nr:two component regulator three y domain-containing protein [Maribacter sp.]